MRRDKSLAQILDVYRSIAIVAAAMTGAILCLCVVAITLSLLGGDLVREILFGLTGLAGITLFSIRYGYFTLRGRVAEAEAAKRSILSAAHRDALTGAHTRSYFFERLRQHVYFGSPDSVGYIQIDMDNLKVLNDTYGHGAGDAALVHLVRMFDQVMPGAIVGRLGGDEFGGAIVGVDNKQALRRLGENLLTALDRPFHVSGTGRTVRLSATLGIAVAPTDTIDPDELISKADLALYSGKRAGRRSVVLFAQDMLGDERHRRFVERDLRAGIMMNELELHYQPIFGPDRTTVTSYEALVRWHHQVRGLIPPSQFIAIAEESDLIDKLGEWVLRRACLDLPALETGSVGINVSPAQLRRTDFADRFAAILAETGTGPERILVEVTESVPILAGGLELTNLMKLRDMGVRIAIDDFGAGHASLYYLRSFAFDVIKIDRTYVSDIQTGHIDAMIVKAICDIACSLQVSVVAEGVETEAQLAVLKRVGCDGFQGYLLGRPQPLAMLRRARLASAA